jgi:uncharacterized protein with HEPN domain
MKPKREFLDYLEDILDAVEQIELFTKNMNFEQFAHDKKTIYAVVRAFEIIGEATKHIPQSVKNRYPKIPWRKMSGIRDKVIHEYFGVKLEVVWESVERDIPALNPLIAQMIKTETQRESSKNT